MLVRIAPMLCLTAIAPPSASSPRGRSYCGHSATMLHNCDKNKGGGVSRFTPSTHRCRNDRAPRPSRAAKRANLSGHCIDRILKETSLRFGLGGTPRDLWSDPRVVGANPVTSASLCIVQCLIRLLEEILEAGGLSGFANADTCGDFQIAPRQREAAA